MSVELTLCQALTVRGRPRLYYKLIVTWFQSASNFVEQKLDSQVNRYDAMFKLFPRHTGPTYW